jgi:RNA polymerase sigma-70 factor, ECF subfamily
MLALAVTSAWMSMDLPLIVRGQGAAMAQASSRTAETFASSATTDAGDDARLLARFAQGDDVAFSELVQRYQHLAYVVACRITGRDDLGHDVVQEAFLRCLRHRHRFDTAKAFKPWLLQIVRHLSIDALRVQRRIDAGTAAGELLERTAAAHSDPAAAGDATDLRHRVASVLASLPEKYRDLLVMRELEGQSAEDIATAIGVDYGTTRWRLHEARRLFRLAWVERFGHADTGGSHG